MNSIKVSGNIVKKFDGIDQAALDVCMSWRVDVLVVLFPDCCHCKSVVSAVRNCNEAER